MNTLFCFTIVLAVAACISAEPADKVEECLRTSGMTVDEASKVGTPGFQPSHSFNCYIGCMSKGDESFNDSPEEEDNELKECVEKIDRTSEDECKIGEQLYLCAEEAGVFPTNADT